MARKSQRSGASGEPGNSSTSTEVQPFTGATAEAILRRFRTILEEQDVTARVVQLIYDAFGPNTLVKAWDEFRCSDSEGDRGTLLEFTPHSPFLEQFTSWLAHTWTPASLSERPERVTNLDQVPTEIFLAQHPNVDLLLGKYLKACIDTPFSFFEVLKCEVGQKFICNDLICGTQRLVIDGAVATILRTHQVLYARIVNLGDVPLIDAAAPWALPEDMKPAILALRRAILEHHSSGVEHARERLRVHELDLRNFYWGFVEQALEEDSLRPQLVYNYSLHKTAERLLAKNSGHDIG